MMTDIVERLRGNFDDGIKRKPSAIKLEAAAEVERLRLRVKFLEDELKCPACERLRQTVNDQAQLIERLTRP